MALMSASSLDDATLGGIVAGAVVGALLLIAIVVVVFVVVRRKRAPPTSTPASLPADSVSTALDRKLRLGAELPIVGNVRHGAENQQRVASAAQSQQRLVRRVAGERGPTG